MLVARPRWYRRFEAVALGSWPAVKLNVPGETLTWKELLPGCQATAGSQCGLAATVEIAIPASLAVASASSRSTRRLPALTIQSWKVTMVSAPGATAAALTTRSEERRVGK